jgi:hypothetical protein
MNPQSKKPTSDLFECKGETRTEVITVGSLQGANATIRRFLRGDSSMDFSSGTLSWPDLLIEQHRAPPGERHKTIIDRPVLILWQGDSVSSGECIGPRGNYIPYEKTPGTLTLFADGQIPPVHPFTYMDMLVCAINPALLSSVAVELQADSRLRGSLRS